MPLSQPGKAQEVEYPVTRNHPTMIFTRLVRHEQASIYIDACSCIYEAVVASLDLRNPSLAAPFHRNHQSNYRIKGMWWHASYFCIQFFNLMCESGCTSRSPHILLAAASHCDHAYQHSGCDLVSLTKIHTLPFQGDL